MAGVPRMLTGVAIRRTVTAKSYAALLTSAKMHPWRSDLHALRALKSAGVFDRGDFVKMRAASVNHNISFIREALFEQKRRQSSLIHIDRFVELCHHFFGWRLILRVRFQDALDFFDGLGIAQSRMCRRYNQL
jgi:hypothetical protein